MSKKEAITEFDKEDMLLMCKRTLAKKYTPREEWGFEDFEQEEDRFVPDFKIWRRVPSPLFRNKSEVIYVTIIIDDLAPIHLTQFNNFLEAHQDENVIVKGKIIVTPSGADTSVAKDSDFELVRLNVFRLEKPRSSKKADL